MFPKRRTQRAFKYFFGLAVLLASVACSDLFGSDRARVTVLLTDAPSDYIGSAMVDIGRVELLPADDGDRIVLSEDGTDGLIDLLELQNLTTAVLADLEIPEGTYREIRMIIEDASVELAEGYTLEDGSTEAELTVPSGASSGLKLKLRADGTAGEDDGDLDESEEGVFISGGQTILVVDFDVNQSFRIQGNPDTPAGLKGVSFRPTLRVVVEEVSGSISGTVTTSVDGASTEGLVVSAERSSTEGDEEFQSSIGTGLTTSDGTYTVFFLSPGSYSVSVEAGDSTLVGTPESIEVELGLADNAIGVDFEIVPRS